MRINQKHVVELKELMDTKNVIHIEYKSGSYEVLGVGKETEEAINNELKFNVVKRPEDTDGYRNRSYKNWSNVVCLLIRDKLSCYNLKDIERKFYNDTEPGIIDSEVKSAFNNTVIVLENIPMVFQENAVEHLTFLLEPNEIYFGIGENHLVPLEMF